VKIHSITAYAIGVCFILLEQVKNQISKRHSTATGFNIGLNDGKDAGQTIMHCHIHLIPRRKDDMADPRGGMRHVILGRGFY
jgi:ATP adenylyltransferase